MSLKRLLLIIPIVFSAGLLQSYFWVPTYDKQVAGNPERLVTYIEGSIGDAKILNPILNADSASSQIVSYVFEGLLDLDQDLNLRARLATDWTITEQAYLLVNPKARLPGGRAVTGKRLARRVRRAISRGTWPELQGVVQSVKVLPAELREEKVTVSVKDQNGKLETMEVEVMIDTPERVAFELSQVDQDFFDRIKKVIGENYTENFPYDKHIGLPPETAQEIEEQVRSRFSELLPITEHNPTILFHLRQGVRFHDGHEFDAGDVKFTYEAIMAPKNLSPRTSDFEPIKDIEILDPYTVRVIYKRLFSPAINAWTMGILPEHLLNDDVLKQEIDKRELSDAARQAFGMRDSEFNRYPIGVGPFRFVEWQTDEFVHLERNNDYWEGRPEYKDYYMRIVPDLLTQEVEFRAGAVDFYGAQPHQVARYKEDETYQSFSSLTFAYTYIGYNNRKPLFQDKRVRRALGMALNVDEFIEYVLYGEGERVTGPYPKNTEWYDHSVEPIPFDPDGAQGLLEELGWKRNEEDWLEKDGKVFEFNLITNSGNPIRKNIMTIAQNAWKKIGVKCNIQYFEWAVFLKDFVNTAQFDAVVLGWSMGIDPDLYQIWHSSQAGPQQLNFVGYQNPQADELIVRMRQEYDRNHQRELAHRLHQVIHEDQPYTFLYVPLSTRVLDKKIVIVERHPDGTEEYKQIYPLKSGNITFYFNKWRKLELTPQF